MDPVKDKNEKKSLDTLRKEVEDSFLECSKVDLGQKQSKESGPIKKLNEDLGRGFTMQKLRKLELEAAKLIQRQFRAYIRRQSTSKDGKELCSRACQTDQETGFYKVTNQFYEKIGNRKDFMATLQKSMFESYALFYIASQMQKKELKKRNQGK